MENINIIKSESEDCVVINVKGGSGKSFISCLSLEYLDSEGKVTRSLDIDYNSSDFQEWVSDCLKARSRRIVQDDKSKDPYDYRIIDTAGVSGSAEQWIDRAKKIIVPFRSQEFDLKRVIRWFVKLKDKDKKKVIFVPNFWQNTLEQRDGLTKFAKFIYGKIRLGRIVAFEEKLEDIKKLVGDNKEESDSIKVEKIFKLLNNRPNAYGSLDKKVNFFQNKKIPLEAREEAKEVMKDIYK